MAVIAGRCCNYTPLALFFTQQPQLVTGAAELERAGVLQVFAFEVNLATGLCRQPGAMGKRRYGHLRAQGNVGLSDGLEQSVEVAVINAHEAVLGLKVLE
ncbi:hypothetical protein D3C77_350920 [compost metagenome]